MTSEERIQSLDKSGVFTFIFAVLTVLFLWGSIIFASEKGPVEDVGSGPARYMSRSLKHISAEQGKKYLADANVGTASQLPNTNMLLVTGQPLDLIKASAILKLVDRKGRFVIKTISPASEAAKLPSSKRIESKVGGISIGTFTDPLLDSTKDNAIIDFHAGSVIAIAPADKIEKIIAAIKQLQKTTEAVDGKMMKRLTKEPVELRTQEPSVPEAGPSVELSDEPEPGAVAGTSPRRPESLGEPADLADAQDHKSDELFSKLLSSLAEAEQKMAELHQASGEPSKSEVEFEPADEIEIQPGIVAALPERDAPRAVSVGLEPDKAETDEPLEDSEQLEEVDLTALIEKLVAEEVAKRLADEAPHEVATEQLPAETAELIEEATEPDAAVGRSYQPKVTTNGNEMLDLDLPEKLEIADLLSLVGEYLHLDYMYDPGKIKGSVALRLRGPIKVKDLYPLLESVLKFQGFVMTRKGGLVTIVPAADVLNIDPVIIDAEKGDIEVGDIIVSRIFRLKYIDTASAKNLLDGMKVGVNINTSASEVGALIVTGYAYRMGRVEELLDMVDKQGEPKEFRFRQLKYTMAATLAPKVKTLAEQLGTVSVTVSAAPAAARRIARKPRESAAAFKSRQARESRARPTAAKPTAATLTVYLDADERTNRILMIGLKEQLAVVDQLIDTLDVEQQDLRTLRLYDIQHVGAEDVLQKLGELGITSGGGRSSRSSSRISGRSATTAGQKTPTRTTPSRTTSRTTSRTGGEALVEEPQVVVIESTNSLLVNATDEQHTQIAVIIGYVDSETLEQAIPYKIYSLENQSPVDVADVLKQLVQETITDKAGKIERVEKRGEEDIVIVDDENTFSLIVYASKKHQEWIGSLIKTLDRRRPQVLIDVSLVEITRNEDFEYDLNIIANAKDAVLGNVAILGGGLPNAAFRLEGGWNLKDSKGNNTYQTTGFYSDDKIQTLLTAIDSKGYGRILARPKILVNDNEAGVIRTTEKTHVAEDTWTYPGSGTGGTVTPVQSVKYNPYEAKIEMTITPHISEGDLLRLEVEMIREDFVETSSGPPDYTTSNINTIVTVPDGSTIILGGLTKLDQGKGGNKVPLLGDIPLVGALFRGVDHTNDERKLYIFVKADILRPDETVEGLEQLRKISEKNRVAFEKAERLFQEYQDIPGIKSEPMDPLRVLETE